MNVCFFSVVVVLRMPRLVVIAMRMSLSLPLTLCDNCLWSSWREENWQTSGFKRTFCVPLNTLWSVTCKMPACTVVVPCHIWWYLPVLWSYPTIYGDTCLYCGRTLPYMVIPACTVVVPCHIWWYLSVLWSYPAIYDDAYLYCGRTLPCMCMVWLFLLVWLEKFLSPKVYVVYGRFHAPFNCLSVCLFVCHVALRLLWREAFEGLIFF